MVTAGIDVGSAAVKVAIAETQDDRSARMLAGRTERIRRRDPVAIAHDVFAEGLQVAGVERKALGYAATTGEGDAIPFRTDHFYGMTQISHSYRRSRCICVESPGTGIDDKKPPLRRLGIPGRAGRGK